MVGIEGIMEWLVLRGYGMVSIERVCYEVVCYG